jgi:hypothetical protein
VFVFIVLSSETRNLLGIVNGDNSIKNGKHSVVEGAGVVQSVY